MIQRIQSILLLLAGGGAFSLFGLPLATTPTASDASVLFADAAFRIQDNLVLMGAFGVAGAILLATIFLFNNRKLQMTLTKVSLLLLVVGVGAAAYFFTTDAAVDSAQVAAGVAMPAIAIVLGILAHRYILKDEKLVRSVDRLR